MSLETKMRDNNETIVAPFYDEWSEDNRLKRDKAHMLGFLSTMHYIDKYLKPGDRILEIGCGTGLYSINIAQRGFNVTALDISNRNLNILKNRTSDDMLITVANMNATNLFSIPDNAYDITLLLGPLYHLFCGQDMSSAIYEAYYYFSIIVVLIFKVLKNILLGLIRNYQANLL